MALLAQNRKTIMGGILEELCRSSAAGLICEAALQNAGPMRAPSSEFPQHSLALDIFVGGIAAQGAEKNDAAVYSFRALA